MRNVLLIALVLALCGRASGQTVEQARQQMLMHKGQLVPPTPEMVHAPSPLLDSPERARELEDALDQRSHGILLTALGSSMEGIALAIFWVTVFGQIGEAFGNILCGLDNPPDCHHTNWDAYRLGAGIVAAVGAVPLIWGLSTWNRGSRRVRAARGYPISIAPAVGADFAGVGATLSF